MYRAPKRPNVPAFRKIWAQSNGTLEQDGPGNQRELASFLPKYTSGSIIRVVRCIRRVLLSSQPIKPYAFKCLLPTMRPQCLDLQSSRIPTPLVSFMTSVKLPDLSEPPQHLASGKSVLSLPLNECFPETPHSRSTAIFTLHCYPRGEYYHCLPTGEVKRWPRLVQGHRAATC